MKKEENKSKVVIINNLDIIWEKDNVLKSTVENDAKNAPTVEVYSVPESIDKMIYNCHEIVRNNFIEIILKSDEDILFKNINNILNAYLDFLNIKGYNKKMLTDLFFDAFNEPYDIIYGHSELINLFNDGASDEEITEYENKLDKNRNVYYDIYKSMNKLMLVLMNDGTSKSNVFERIKCLFVKELKLQNISDINKTIFNEKYTFNTFVSDDSNKIALGAASKISENNGAVYSPLYIYSDIGLGKTHLLKAIGNSILEKDKKLKVLYIQAHEYVDDYMKSANRNDVLSFNMEYLNADVLLIDDIQMLSNKAGTQREFLKLLTEFENNNKRIIITANLLPNKLNGFFDSIVARFNSGIIVNIDHPDLNHRINILKQKVSEKSNIIIPEDVLSFISQNYTDNVRELEGALNRVLLYSEINNEEITLELAKAALNL